MLGAPEKAPRGGRLTPSGESCGTRMLDPPLWQQSPVSGADFVQQCLGRAPPSGILAGKRLLLASCSTDRLLSDFNWHVHLASDALAARTDIVPALRWFGVTRMGALEHSCPIGGGGMGEVLSSPSVPDGRFRMQVAIKLYSLRGARIWRACWKRARAAGSA